MYVPTAADLLILTAYSYNWYYPNDGQRQRKRNNPDMQSDHQTLAVQGGGYLFYFIVYFVILFYFISYKHLICTITVVTELLMPGNTLRMGMTSQAAVNWALVL